MLQQISYLAGIFDGEGYAGIVKVSNRSKGLHKKSAKTRFLAKQSYTRPMVQIGMSDPEPAAMFHKLFGGSIRITTPQKKDWLPLHRWTVVSRQAEKAAGVLIKFSQVERKKQQLREVLDYYATSAS